MGNIRSKSTDSIRRTVTGEDYPLNQHAMHVHVKGGTVSLGSTTNTTTTIYNVTVGTANTEFSQALPANTKRFLLKSRNSAKIDFYYSSGATETLTINPGFSFEDSNFYVGQTVYFKCSKPDVVEIVAYT